MNRRQFLKLLGLTLISPLLKACDGLFGTPTATPTVIPSLTGTSVPSTGTTTKTPTETPTETPTPAAGAFFSLHPFIEAHPEAVFIKPTKVFVKTDAEAKRQEGLQFAQDIFVYGSAVGISLSHKIAIKANVTDTEGMGNTEAGMGIITDVHFVEGLIEGMKGLGFQSSNLYLREGNWLKDGYCANDLPMTGYVEMAERTEIHSLYFPSGRRITDLTLETLEEGTEVIWKDAPNGVVFRRIGYVSPYNQEDTWLLNVSKFKAHHMGMTLCTKNLQGMCVSPHVRF